MLLQHRIKQINALQVVVPRELLRLVSDGGERVLHGRAGQEFGSPHQGEIFSDFVIDIALHGGHSEVQVYDEIPVLVGVCCS